jgi:ribonuclease-3
MKPGNISALAEALGHGFEDMELLKKALTHSSHARELEAQNASGGEIEAVSDNEQLEFLGDAVLALVTSQELFERFPQYQEGELSKIRAYLVSEKHLIRPARQLGLGKYLRLGRGEEKSGGRSKTALQVDALEAVVAAIYLDAGLSAARQFILQQILAPELKRLEKHSRGGLPITDFKSALQEMAHSSARLQPSYVLVKEEGPAHKKMFTVEARIHSSPEGKIEYTGRGAGPTKKTAEQDAAKQAMEYLLGRQQDAGKPNGRRRGTPSDPSGGK